MYKAIGGDAMQKAHKAFVYKLLIFFVIVFFLDFAAGSVLKHFYYVQKSGILYRTTYAIEETKADILIFGTSKANHSYNPEIFSERLNTSTYNVGRDGGSVLYDYALLTSITQRYIPKIIILDVSWEFEKKQEAYDRLSMLLPYYKTHPEIQSIIELKSRYEKIKLLSRVYPYNSMLFTILAGNLRNNKAGTTELNGYVPLFKVWKNEIKIYDIPDYEIDSAKINYYKSFIKKCISLNVKLYIVISPDFMQLKKTEKSAIMARNYAEYYNIDFFDYSTDPLFLENSKYFADPTHLNADGALVFTNLLIDKIEQDIKGK